MTAHVANWISLQGAVNVRDVGGLSTSDGRTVRPRVLIRSANLQTLTEADVVHLVDELGVRRIVDLRTDVEVDECEPGPMHRQPSVVIRHLSLYPDSAIGQSRPPDALMPWHGERHTSKYPPAVAAYLRYLQRRPDSLIAALRTIAEPDGATVVHCAAGKDRTGVVIALALSIAGVSAESIAADYAQSQLQIAAILRQLSQSTLYERETRRPDQVPPASAEVMLQVLEAIETDFGGVFGWLTSQGWAEADTQQLQAKLLG